MGHREYLDQKGEKWDVWLVLPTSAERRKEERRVAAGAGASSYAGEERRGRMPDRRLSSRMSRAVIDKEFKDGWLCFESHRGEKRRLMPVPEKWQEMSTAQLHKLCSEAKRVVRCGILP